MQKIDLTQTAEKASKSLPTATQIFVKSFQWGQLNAGDCVMQAGSTFTFYSNGLWEFNAVVWTNHTHSGDTWRHQVNLFDTNGHPLWSTGPFDGPHGMNDDGSHYPFGPVRGTFDPTFFDASASANANANC